MLKQIHSFQISSNWKHCFCLNLIHPGTIGGKNLVNINFGNTQNLIISIYMNFMNIIDPGRGFV